MVKLRSEIDRNTILIDDSDEENPIESGFLQNLKLDFGNLYEETIFDTPFTGQELFDLGEYWSIKDPKEILDAIYEQEGKEGLIRFYRLGDYFDVPSLRNAIGLKLYEISKPRVKKYKKIKSCETFIEPYLKEDFLKNNRFFELGQEDHFVELETNPDLTLSEEVARNANNCNMTFAVLSYLDLPTFDISNANLTFEYTPTGNYLYYFGKVVAELVPYNEKIHPYVLYRAKYIFNTYPISSRNDFIIYGKDMLRLEEGTLVNGKKNGHWKEWDETGNILFDTHWKDNKRSGYWIWYDPSIPGKILREGEYLDGDKIGPWRELIRDGTYYVENY